MHSTSVYVTYVSMFISLGTCIHASLFVCLFICAATARAGSAIKQHLDSILLARWAEGSLTAGAAATDHRLFNMESFILFYQKTIWPHFLTCRAASSSCCTSFFFFLLIIMCSFGILLAFFTPKCCTTEALLCGKELNVIICCGN